MRGLHRLTNAANRIQAWQDFRELAADVISSGHEELVREHLPPEGAGWRTIDKHIKALREAIDAAGSPRKG